MSYSLDPSWGKHGRWIILYTNVHGVSEVLKYASKAKQWVRSPSRAHLKVFSQWTHYTDILHPVRLASAPASEKFLCQVKPFTGLPEQSVLLVKAACLFRRPLYFWGCGSILQGRKLWTGAGPRHSLLYSLMQGKALMSSPHKPHPMAGLLWDLAFSQKTTSASS